MNFETKFDEFRKIIENRIKEVTQIFEPHDLYEPYNYFMAEGGKRIRPALTMMACGAAGGQPENALDCGIALEIMHNFTLVHDDIMDKSDFRRNRPTVHKKWNESIAILTGDAMIGFAYKLIPNHKRYFEIIQTFTNGLIEVCEGQVYDMQFNTSQNVKIDDYLKMIGKKTSALLETCCVIGGLVADADNKIIGALKNYAKYLGLAFQIQDDLLDMIADEKVFGKKVGLDIQEGKKTYLVILANERAQKPEHIDLLNKYYNSNGLSAEYVPRFNEMFIALGIFDEAKRKIAEYFKSAEDELSLLPDNDYKNMLKWLLDKLNNRNY
jgi:geranylgeranyl diphosphate synthase type II